MKKIDKIIIKRAIALTMVLAVVFYCLNEICRTAVYNERHLLINYVSELPEDSVDVLIMGNSHAEYGLNGSLIGDMLDKNVVNYAFTQQQTPLTYYLLKNVFKKQSAEIVIVEAYTLIQQVQKGYDYVPLSAAKIKYYNMMKSEGFFLECFFPIAFYHNFWAEENPIQSVIKNNTEALGSIQPYLLTAVMSDIAVERHNTYNPESFITPFYDYRFDNLEEIYELCEKNGSQLIVTMLPLYGTLIENIDYEGIYYDTLKEFCNENDILYYDYNIESRTDWQYIYFQEQDYTHNSHLNSYGQTIASIELAQFLADSNEYLDISEYTIPEIKIEELFNSFDYSNNILIIDDCPSDFNETINPELQETFTKLNLTLNEKTSDTTETYLISSEGINYNYLLPSDIDFLEDGITIYEIDENNNIIKRAYARWDLFDTAIIR